MTLKIGIALGGHRNAASWKKALKTVELADQLGLHSVWLPENHFRLDATSSPLVALAASVSMSERVQLATASILLPIHNPLRVAAEIATLDVLSGGRTIVGLGRGFQARMFEAFGIAQNTKRNRFEEALDVILAAWSGEPFRLKGSYYEGNDQLTMPCALRPLQKPHPPLVVAAFGPKGLRQAAQRALPYLASPIETLPMLQKNYRIWKRHAPATLPRTYPQVPIMRTAFISENNLKCKSVREAIQQEFLRSKQRAPSIIANGSETNISERIIVGSINQVYESLTRYQDVLNMDLLIVRAWVPGASEEDCTRSLEHFAQDVSPKL